MRLGLVPSPPHLPRLGANTHLPALQIRPRLGCAGYCGLGLRNQQDTRIPKLVPAFSGDREISRGASVYAGLTCSAVIDWSGMYWLAENGGSLAMAVAGNLGAVSDLYRMPCK